MNSYLTQYFLNLPMITIEQQNILSLTNDNNCITKINNLNMNWSYEILSEKYVEDETGYCVTIALYLPGYVRTGVGMSHTDFGREHKFNAIKKAICNACSTFNRLSDNCNTSEHVISDTKQNNNTNNAVSDKNGINNNISSNNKLEFTQAQVDNIIQFKKDYAIANDEQFARYLTMWNPKVITKFQLTPNNIDSFIEWVKNLSVSVM